MEKNIKSFVLILVMLIGIIGILQSCNSKKGTQSEQSGRNLGQSQVQDQSLDQGQDQSQGRGQGQGYGKRMGYGKGKGHGHQRGMSSEGMSEIRHRFVRDNGIDSKYESKVNPLEFTDENLAKGKQLFNNNCTVCHGETGVGDGPIGQELKPPASDIADFSKRRMATDDYLLWTISEGGIPVKSGMTPFKNTLSEEEIWLIILYLRKL